jgi:hypothetical protein
MSNAKDSLGGRLPLVKPEEPSRTQRPVYEKIDKGMVAWANRYGFKGIDDSGRLIGPFSLLLYSPASTLGLLAFTEAEEECATLTERERRVIILSVGSVWNPPYEIYVLIGYFQFQPSRVP